jgi:hypothetical protein
MQYVTTIGRNNGSVNRQLLATTTQDIRELIELLPQGTEVGVDYLGCLTFRTSEGTESILWSPMDIGLVEELFEQAGFICVEEHYLMDGGGSIGLSNAYQDKHPIIVYSKPFIDHSLEYHSWSPYSWIDGHPIKLPSMLQVNIDHVDPHRPTICLKSW